MKLGDCGGCSILMTRSHVSYIRSHSKTIKYGNANTEFPFRNFAGHFWHLFEVIRTEHLSPIACNDLFEVIRTEHLSSIACNDLPSFSQKADACIIPADVQVCDKFAGMRYRS
jgi:hypothetical protein